MVAELTVRDVALDNVRSIGSQAISYTTIESNLDMQTGDGVTRKRCDGQCLHVCVAVHSNTDLRLVLAITV